MSNWARKKSGLYADGWDKVGSLIEYTPPILEVETEDFRAGGMDMSVPMDMGMAAMEASFTIGEDKDILSMFGIKKNGKKIPLYIRSHLENDITGEKKSVKEELRGIITKIDQGTKTSGSFTPMTVSIKLSYYKYEMDEQIIHEIDPLNLIRTIDGVDQLADTRASLGK